MATKSRYLILLATAFLLGISSNLSAADPTSKRLPTYFPNTEELSADEMRITALGTGLPTPLTRAQKSTSWLVELGNGDVFLFDIGTGSMENLFGLRPATYVTSYIHTPPEGFGKVMSEIKPRMAVAYHTVLLPDIHQGMLEGIRKTYDGPLTIATDLMVWNVTKDSIIMRMASFPDRVTPPSTTEAYKSASRSGEAKMSKYIMDGVWEGFTPPPLPKE